MNTLPALARMIENLTVKSRNGRSSRQPLSKLTPEGQPNALTRMLAGEQ